MAVKIYGNMRSCMTENVHSQGSLFDLVDKCLIVNPRLRISADDALKHEFFAPCHEVPRKKRKLRQGTNSEPGMSHPVYGQRNAGTS
ncbi:hypothetical protein HS088_TW20G00011 [Tripterygium wilfordii]|uniref:Uncharacterized protein n=1 Tax=Tripterygium wilfordii TaxID=458696 RepID=A0A7J7C716_TRIWF|nr:hypothetical protein HS088_TW20G00011 [Tripterygium wilfordii]